MLDFAINMCLSLCQPEKLEFLIVILYLFTKDKEFKYMMLLFAFTMLYNIVLKTSIGIPLPDTCQIKGFGFPSGHIHISCIFYIWLILRYRNMAIIVLSLAVVFASCYAEIYRGYHYVSDAIFAPLFSWVTVASYMFLLQKKSNDIKYIALLSAAALMVLIIYGLGMPFYNDTYVLMTFYHIMGFCLASMLFKRKSFGLINILYVGLIGCVSYSLKGTESTLLNQTYNIFIAAMLPLTKAILERLVHNVKFAKSRSNRGVTFSVVFTRDKIMREILSLIHI